MQMKKFASAVNEKYLIILNFTFLLCENSNK